MAAGASPIDWIADWSTLGSWGWTPRFPSDLNSLTCSRHLIDWALRPSLQKRRLKPSFFRQSTKVFDLVKLSPSI